MEIDLETHLRENPIELVLVGYIDIDGIVRAKYLSAQKILKSLSTNLGFRSAVISSDYANEFYS